MVIHLTRKLDRLDAVIRWVARARLPTTYTLRIPVMARSILHLLDAELLDVVRGGCGSLRGADHFALRDMDDKLSRDSTIHRSLDLLSNLLPRREIRYESLPGSAVWSLLNADCWSGVALQQVMTS